MDRDSEGLRRRMAESAASSAADEDSDDEQTYAVREGITRAIDDEELELHRGRNDADEGMARVSADRAPSLEPRLDAPPDLPEMADVSSVAPDGSSVGRGGLTDPVSGQAIGGGSLVDEITGRGAALGGDALTGSRLDPLGMLGGQGSTAGRTGGPGSGLQSRDGSAVSSGTGPGSDAHFNTVNEMRGASGLPDLTRDEYNAAFGIGGGGDAGGAGDTGGGGDSGAGGGRGTFDSVGGFGISDAAWAAVDEFQTQTLMDWVGEYGAAEVFPADEDGKSAAEEIQEGLHDSYTNFGSDDDVDDDEKPDPTGGYDTITGANAEQALRGRGIAPYAQPTQEGDSGGQVTDVNLAWGTAGEDPRLAQYGPDGPEAVPDDATVTPPTDDVVDPPQEGSAASVGDASGAAAAGPVEMKLDANNVAVDMVTGQVIGSAAPATGGELDGAGGLVSQGDEDDGDGGGGVQSLTAGVGAPLSGAGLAGAGTMNAGGGLVSQGDEGDGDDDGGVQAFVADDAALAMGEPDAGMGGADALGAPIVEGSVPMGEEGAPGAPPGGEG